MHGNSNPSGPKIPVKNQMTDEPLNPNHWDNLR